MIQRCHNPMNPGRKNYGGRGIAVCPRWRESFENFVADMGLRPSPTHSIERIDNDQGYTPDNCRWATQQEQMRNFRRSRRLTHNGQTLTLGEWAERTGINRTTIASRIGRDGWSVDDALSIPAEKHYPAHG